MMKRRLLRLAVFVLFTAVGLSFAAAQGRAKLTPKEGQNLDQTYTFQLSYLDGMVQADLQEEAFLADKMVEKVTINESTQEVSITIAYQDMGLAEVHDFLQGYLDKRFVERNPGYGPEDFQTTRQ